MLLKHKIFAIVGMQGSGKTSLAEYYAKNHHLTFIRFGQIILNEIKRLKQSPTENNERKIRNSIRQKYGSAALAILNTDFLKKEIKKNSIVIDGLYSWSEYKYLKKTFNTKLIIIAVHAKPSIRYERLTKRTLKKSDVVMKNRPSTKKEAKKRDYHEIEEIEKAGPIVMADYLLINETSKEFMKKKARKIIKPYL